MANAFKEEDGGSDDTKGQESIENFLVLWSVHQTFLCDLQFSEEKPVARKTTDVYDSKNNW